jgi:hypothetical protein
MTPLIRIAPPNHQEQYVTDNTAPTPGQHAARVTELEAALRDALEGMEDMVGYVPEYFRERWSHQGYIDRARAALGVED